jgi:hypothetical protein
MVKKVFVFSLQRAKAHDEPASPSTLGARFQNQKRELPAMLRFRGTDSGRRGWKAHAAQISPVRELPALRFFGGIGSNNRAEELQDP